MKSKNTKKGMILNSTLAAALMAVVGAGTFFTPNQEAQAVTFYCANCSTFYQQMFEYAEQVNTALNTADQLRTQMQQYDNMIKQGMQLPDRVFNQISADLERVTGVYKDAQSLGRNLSNLDTKFKEQFGSYDNYLKANGQPISNLYEKWSAQGLDNAKTAMNAVGVNTSTFASEDAMLSQIVNRSQNATGRMQAIQAGNEIAAQNVQQLQKLRDLTATQIQLQSNYMAQMQEQSNVNDAATIKFKQRKINNSADPGY